MRIGCPAFQFRLATSLSPFNAILRLSPMKSGLSDHAVEELRLLFEVEFGEAVTIDEIRVIANDMIQLHAALRRDPKRW